MKRSALILTAFAFMTGTVLTNCSTPAQKVENAQDNVRDAKSDLREAKEAYLVDMEKYREETALKIAANNKTIAEFNIRIENEKQDAKAAYKLKIAALEQKNSDMKMRLDVYKSDGKENWEAFKAEFNRDMDALGNAFNDLTVNNVK